MSSGDVEHLGKLNLILTGAPIPLNEPQYQEDFKTINVRIRTLRKYGCSKESGRLQAAKTDLLLLQFFSSGSPQHLDCLLLTAQERHYQELLRFIQNKKEADRRLQSSQFLKISRAFLLKYPGKSSYAVDIALNDFFNAQFEEITSGSPL